MKNAHKNSTTVRSSKTIPTDRLSRGFVYGLSRGLRALDAIAPALATRLASTLFVTPPTRRSHRTATARASAALPLMQRFKITCESKQLWAYSFGGLAQSKPIVLLVHGWGGYGLQFAGLIPALVEAGFRVVTVDMPAHGASPGRTTNAFEFRAAIQTLAKQVGQPTGVIAHSFGAMPTALAMRDGLEPAFSVFLAPMTSFRFAMDAFAAQLQLPEALKQRTADHFEQRFGISRAGLELAERSSAHGVPLMIVHDHEDSRVPIALGRALAEAWPGAELLATRGLGHVRVLSDARVTERVVAFTRSHGMLGAYPERAGAA